MLDRQVALRRSASREQRTFEAAAPLAGSSAFRQVSLHERCVVCDEVTGGGRCRRCAAPRCEGHALPAGRRCERCEEDYRRTLEQRRPDFPWYSLVVLCLGAGSCCEALPPWLALTLTMLVASPIAVFGYRRRLLRARFLDERPFWRYRP